MLEPFFNTHRELRLKDPMPWYTRERTAGSEIASQSGPGGLPPQRHENLFHLPQVCRRDTDHRASFHFRTPGIGLIVKGIFGLSIKAVCGAIKNFEITCIDQDTLALSQIVAYRPFDDGRTGMPRSGQSVYSGQHFTR